jgi:hypothetical protein
MGGVVTAMTGVHRLVTATGRAVPPPFSAEGEEVGAGHCLGTAMPRVVHHPIFPEAGDFTHLAKGVTTTTMAVHRP